MAEKYDMGLYDSGTGDSLDALKVVDVTKEQSRYKAMTLAFTKAQRGRIVQVDGDGVRTHYFMDERGGRQMMAEDCDRWGFVPDGLLTLADHHAPE